jgi:hypothetical protein
VGYLEGEGVGRRERDRCGCLVGEDVPEGRLEGQVLGGSGLAVVVRVGILVWLVEGWGLGTIVGQAVGVVVGTLDGYTVGAEDGHTVVSRPVSGVLKSTNVDWTLGRVLATAAALLETSTASKRKLSVPFIVVSFLEHNGIIAVELKTSKS